VVSLLGFFLIACGSSGAGGSGDGDSGAQGPDAAQICRALGERVDTTTRAHDDFQLSCGGGAAALDDAYTYTAETEGFYQFTAQALPGQTGHAPAVAVLDGDCTGTELACGCHSYEVNGNRESTAIVHLDAEETVTVVAEECDGAAAESNLAVIERSCPAGAAPSTGSSMPVMARGEVVALPCTTCFDGSRSCVQATLSWTAPQTGTYQFAVNEGYAGDDVAVAVLRTDCQGQVAACQTDAMLASTTVAVNAGETFIVVVESTFFDPQPMGYASPTLRVQKTLENP
jgi:hypothetical protein